MTLDGVDTDKVVGQIDAVVVKRRSGTPRTRKVHQLVGAGTSEVFGVHNSSLVNLLRGVSERIFFVDYGQGLQPPLEASEAEFKAAIGPAERFLKRAHHVGKFTTEQFINCYRGDARKVRRYTEAAKSVAITPVSGRDARVMSFVKAEKCNFSAKADPAPRIISPRDPRYNIELGRFIKPLEGVLYKRLNEMCGGVTVMKGLNAKQVGMAIADAWSSFGDPVAVPCDAKRFDQHTRQQALEFEQRVYLAHFCGGDRYDLNRLLKMQLHSKCVGYTPEGVVKFDFNIRASGDMNTGLGTCVIACSAVYSYFKPLGVRFRLIDNGDDCVIIVEKRDLGAVAGFHDHCLKLGYYMVMEEPVYDIEKIDFCQSSPVWDGDSYRMVRKFPTSFSKDMISLLPLKTLSDWKRWANDVGNSGMALNAGIPVAQAMYSCLNRSGCGTFGAHPWLVDSGASILAKGLEANPLPISERSRFSFWLAFGISPAEQVTIEAVYNQSLFTFSDDLSGYTLEFTQQPTHTHYNTIL